MPAACPGPLVVRTLRREGMDRRPSPKGEGGRVFRGAGVEVVRVRKHRDIVDPNGFSFRTVDLLAGVQGRFRVEFADRRWYSLTLRVGDVLLLPPRTKYRASRWPQRGTTPPVFGAIYPRRTERRSLSDWSVEEDGSPVGGPARRIR